MNVTREIIEVNEKCFKGHQLAFPPDFNENDFSSSLGFNIFSSSFHHFDGFQMNASVLIRIFAVLWRGRNSILVGTRSLNTSIRDQQFAEVRNPRFWSSPDDETRSHSLAHRMTLKKAAEWKDHQQSYYTACRRRNNNNSLMENNYRKSSIML